MSRRFVSSSPDWDRRPPQPAHRRLHMHGPLQPMARPPRCLGWLLDLAALAVGFATLGYLVASLYFRSA